VTTCLSVAGDLLREAASRKWFLGLALAITALLGVIGFSLELEVVDGALAGTRLFGSVFDGSIRSADVALRPLFAAASGLIFFGGTVFMILACSDFAPRLLAPGRIEHLLALPVRRWELLLGTWLGVVALGLLSAAYGAGGLALILGVKTGVWTLAPLLAALLAVANFAAIYSAMLAAATFVRSAALCAAAGGLLYALGIVAGFRADIAPLFSEGAGRRAFEWATLLIPRVSELGRTAIALSASEPVDLAALGSLLAGFGVFALGALAVACWRFEEKDF
jgi:ABC-type transport system involved in multi-copper enzyme maturation permease subunit